MGRQRKSKVEKCPVKMRFKMLADGRQSIYLDRFADGKHHYEYLQLYLLPETSAKAKRENARTLCQANALLQERAEALINEKAESMLPSSDDGLLLVDWVQTCYENHEKRGARDLRGIYNLKVNLGKFRPEQLLENVDRQFCLDYIAWLRNEYQTKWGELVKSKTAHSYTTCLRTMLNEAVRAGHIETNPWNLLGQIEKVKEPESKREYLTIDEVKRLSETSHFNERIRQAYLFACFTGLRISDMRRLRWQDISMAGKQWTVSVVMQKTSAPLVLPLSKQARKWLPEEGNADACIFDGLPNMGNLELNLKTWAKNAGISKNVTFHTARHTFATMMLTLGADIYTVSKLLGHRSVRATQIYAKIIDCKKDEAVNFANEIF